MAQTDLFFDSAWLLAAGSDAELIHVFGSEHQMWQEGEWVMDFGH